MKYLKKIGKLNEDFYLIKRDDEYFLKSEIDGTVVVIFEYDKGEILMKPLSTWRRFTVDEVSEILEHMKLVIQSDKFNL